jgi:hypothetical protein
MILRGLSGLSVSLYGRCVVVLCTGYQESLAYIRSSERLFMAI